MRRMEKEFRFNGRWFVRKSEPLYGDRLLTRVTVTEIIGDYGIRTQVRTYRELENIAKEVIVRADKKGEKPWESLK